MMGKHRKEDWKKVFWTDESNFEVLTTTLFCNALPYTPILDSTGEQQSVWGRREKKKELRKRQEKLRN